MELLGEIVVLVVLTGGVVGMLVWSWRRATDSAREYLGRVLDAGAVEFSPPVYGRLLRHFTWRDRLHLPALFVIVLRVLAAADPRPTSWRFAVTMLVVFALVIAAAVGAALVTLPLRAAGRSETRVAALRPRTVRRHPHPAELAVGGLAFLLGITSLGLVLWRFREVD